MRLGTRIFFCYLLIFVACFSYPISWILDDLRIRYLEGVEEPLVDQANVLASIVSLDMEEHQFDSQQWHHIFNHAYARPLGARIYSLVKTHVDVRVYMTDLSGNVLFDSEYPQNEGTDYSLWRDVYLTLQGQYGARTSRKPSTSVSDIREPQTSELYVAAPILVKGELAGALSVGKPTMNIDRFLQSAKPRIFKVGLLSGSIAILLSYLVSLWLTRPIKSLTRYAEAIGEGKRTAFPKLGRSEIGAMGLAFQKMQEALEGKKYVEQYTQTLTHEIKSPLSAIRGAAELLEEGVPQEQQTRFLENIRTEANRIQQIVDRMLELAALENLKNLENMKNVALKSIVKTVLESKEPMLSKKNIQVNVQVQDELSVKGDSFLLHQAISNLLQNAIDFSPEHGQIDLRMQIAEQQLHLIVEDNGSGIPDYALDKIFDKFFSLQRPDSGKKSTGLGLNFVKEVATLHNGDIKLENRPEKGVRATLALPL
jgi:two-component system sensor histidine kinase CreC